MQEIALTVWSAGPLTQFSGWVDILAGDLAAAERSLRQGVEVLREIGELSWLSTVAGILAEALYEQGRHEEAEEFLGVCEETAGREDAYSQTLLRGIRAKMLARRGEADAAERLAREAVAFAEPTDFLFLQAFALLCQGEVLQVLGRRDEAESVLLEASRACDQKGFTVGTKRARDLLEAAATGT